MIINMCVKIVFLAARLPSMPKLADKVAAIATIAILKFYRHRLSQHSRRTCLFKVSCSRKAIEFVSKDGFLRGIKDSALQLKRCGGEFTVVRDCTGSRTLITNDGSRFYDVDLADGLTL